MANYKKSTLAIAAMVALCAANGLSATYTNKWTGAANNLLFFDAANWESQNEGVTASALLANDCSNDRVIYDFSDLPSGSTVSAKADAKKSFYLTGLIFSGSGDSTWTLSATRSDINFCFRNTSPEWNVMGGQLNLAVNNFINWGGDGNNLTIKGGGIVRICQPSSYSPQYYNDKFVLTGSTKLILAHANACKFQGVYLNSGTATVELECDTKLSLVETAESATGTQLILNGHTLTVYRGAKSLGPSSGVFYGNVIGPGKIVVSGSFRQTFRKQLPETVAFVQNQAEIAFGTQDKPTHSQEPFPFTINMGARSFFYGDVTFSTLSGTGVTGSPVLPPGKTITVAGSGAANEMSHLQSAITGDVSVVKSGANYELELSGENGYRGATTVSSGTLSISAPIHREGLIAYYGFEDANDLGRDSSEAGTHLRQGGSGKVSCVADGVIGKAAHFTADGSGMRLESSTSSDSATYSNGAVLSPRFPKGTNAFSVSVWFRPSGACPYNGNIIQFGMNSSRSLCAFSMALRDGSTATDRKTVMVNFKDYGPTCTSPTKLNDGNWHHLATIQSNGYFRAYLDGVSVLGGRPSKDATYNQINLGEGPLFIGYGDLWGDAKAFDGDIDEVMIFDRVLSPDEIQAEYNLKRPAPDLDYNPVAALPEPLCQWTFDDSTNIGKDAGPLGVDLVSSGTVSSVSATSVIPHKGGAIQINGAGLLQLPAGETLPEEFPRGNESFTVFIRARNNAANEQTPLISWGTASSYHLFELGINSYERVWSVLFEATGNSNTMTGGDDVSNQGSCADVLYWSNLVLSYDGNQRTASFYINGVFKGVRRTRAAGLALDAQNFMIGGRVDNNVRLKGYIDEVRIYDRALSCGEVRLLEETFWDDARGPVIPASSELTVADGATFKVAAGAHTVAQGVKGAGAIEVSKNAAVRLGNMSDFTGSLAGLGSLTLADTTFGGSIGSFAGMLTVDDSSVTLPSTKSDCAFALKDGAVVKIAALSALPFTAVAASGAVTIDVSSVVDQLKGKSVKVFSLPAASVADGTSFTVVGNGAKIVAAEYDAEGGALNLRVRQGFSILLR